MEQEIKIQQELGAKEYNLGVSLLATCQSDFQEASYIKAIDSLIEAFTARYKRTEILELLEQIIYRPNVVAMRQNYESNVCTLGEKYGCIPKFDDLDFLILPVTNEYYRTYYKEDGEFKAYGIIVQSDQLWTKLMLGSKEEVLAPEFIESLEQKENDEMAFVLYQDIYDVLANHKQDEYILEKIEVYHGLRPLCEKYDWMLGRYYYNQGAYEKAKNYALRANKVRKFNFDICILLADCYYEEENYIEAVYLYVLMDKISRNSMTGELSPKIRQCVQQVKIKFPQQLDWFLNKVVVALSKPNVFPLVEKVQIDECNNILDVGKAFYSGFLDNEDEYRLFKGLYNEQYEFGLNAVYLEVLEKGVSDKSDQSPAQQHIYYDLVRSKEAEIQTYQKENVVKIVPVAATQQGQIVNFKQNGQESSLQLGQYEYQHFRLNDTVEICSNAPLLFGKMIKLQHNPKRKKLVLNILVDALSFGLMKKEDYKQIPNIMKFFSKGIIFNNNYTPSEWTYPSFAAIQTGLMPAKTQIFHANAMAQLSPEYKTTAEYFNELGYNCISIMGGIDRVFNGLYRGFDRAIAAYLMKSYIGVERTIQYLEAFKETDNFIYLHVDDVHPIYSPAYQIGIKTQTSVDALERCNVSTEKSVKVSQTILNNRQYRQALDNVDRALGYLFDFIEKNYADEEVIVNLCSDHGVPIFSKEKSTLGEMHASTALMVRGANVPQKGIVNELTSTIDLYSIMAHLEGYQIKEYELDSRLPKIFGGLGRDYVVSNTLYPEQPYRMAIRDEKYAFCLDTLENVTYDGYINMNKFKYKMFTKDAEEKEVFDNKSVNHYIKIANDYVKNLHDPDFQKKNIL